MRGVDLARAIAVIGMVAVHVGPTGDDSTAGTIYSLPHGRASILFALVAGVGVSLLATSPRSTTARTRIDLCWRAALLIPLGLALQELDGHRILVVLASYGALFVLAAMVVGLRDRWLLTGAGLAGVLGPVAFAAGRMTDPVAFERAPITWGPAVGDLVRDLVASGPYPLVTWAAPFLLGMWLGRRDLGALGVRLGLLTVGGVVTAVAAVTGRLLDLAAGPPDPTSWVQLIDGAPHSQMHPWLIGATATAAFVLGVALLSADALGRIAQPLVALGRMPLTFYVAHLLALQWVGRDVLASSEVPGATARVAGFAIIGAVAASAWFAVAPRGPLEAVLAAPRLVAARRDGR